MPGVIREVQSLEAGGKYDVYANGTQVDAVRLVIIDGRTGWIARNDWDEMETVDLRQWIDTFNIVESAPAAPEHLSRHTS